ncbi:MAG: Asp-tRNA(Asn)/Glu-tRNA(Gln) amidotransferase subunit GatC [Acidimicrobiia bacterium]
MPVEIDIAHVARLARLDLAEEELQLYRGQLEVILEHATRVQALPAEDVPPTSHPLPIESAFRADQVADCLDREEVLAEAPDRFEGFFRVPRILEEEQG